MTTPHSDYEPVFHFRPARHWMNDPNGPVFVDGEYHLFFQHNPHADTWGDVGWGHAVSSDLLHWSELPVALPASAEGMAFSGSVVIDAANSSGLGSNAEPVMAALYTNHVERGGHISQSQYLAWSTDRGRHWQRFGGNPVLDIGSASFRDPKVFRHTPSGRWIMVVALASERQVALYASPDLIHWKPLSRFGPHGNTRGEWECPDLFPVRIGAGDGTVKWVLKVDCTLGAVAGGSGSQYFVGDFDGAEFRADWTGELSVPYGEGARPVDYGSDFYAAMVWAGLPEGQDPIWLGWMSNWQYAATTPTAPWRGVMSVPRSLHLVCDDGVVGLRQKPLPQIATLRRTHHEFHDVHLHDGQSLVMTERGYRAMELRLQAAASGGGRLALQFLRSGGSLFEIVLDPRGGTISVDRRHAARVAFHPDFPALHAAPLRAANGRLDVHVLIDGCCLEIFADGGATVLSELIFPDGDPGAVRCACTRGDVLISGLDLWDLR